jgi:hypothetical protein
MANANLPFQVPDAATHTDRAGVVQSLMAEGAPAAQAMAALCRVGRRRDRRGEIRSNFIAASA